MTLSFVEHMLFNGVVVVGVVVLIRQCRKPAWWPGRLFVAGMNESHSSLTDWGLKRVRLDPAFTILDVGCGGGRTIAKLASVAVRGKVYGIDYSKTCVDASRRENADTIKEGRVEVRQASVSSLPFPDATFDVVTAVETHYYWPDLAADLREVLRVLKPGGSLLIIAEAYKGRPFDWIYRPVMMMLGATYLTPEGHGAALESAGFADVAVDVERGHGWICALGTRPRAAGAVVGGQTA